MFLSVTLTGTLAFVVGHRCLKVVGVFFFFVFFCFYLAHSRPNRGLSLALHCLGRWRGKVKLSCGHLTLFQFIVLCHMPLFYMLASLRSLAIFENQTIAIPSWFKQWYLNVFELRKSHRLNEKKCMHLLYRCILQLCYHGGSSEETLHKLAVKQNRSGFESGKR